MQKVQKLPLDLNLYGNEFSKFLDIGKRAYDNSVGVESILFDYYQNYISLTTGHVLQGFEHYDIKFVELLGNGVGDILEEPETTWLSTALDKFLASENAHVIPSSVTGAFKRYAAVKVFRETFGSEESRLDRSSYIMASWCDNDGDIQVEHDLRPGRVLYYMHLFVKLSNDTEISVVLAKVQWYQPHPSKDLFHNDNIHVWVKDLYEVSGPGSFMPVHRIKTKFVSGFVKKNGETVRVVIPRTEHVF